MKGRNELVHIHIACNGRLLKALGRSLLLLTGVVAATAMFGYGLVF